MLDLKTRRKIIREFRVEVDEEIKGMIESSGVNGIIEGQVILDSTRCLEDTMKSIHRLENRNEIIAILLHYDIGLKKTYYTSVNWPEAMEKQGDL